MFTGIVEAKGVVTSRSERRAGVSLRIEAPFAAELRVDQSVAVDGACLTVVASGGDHFEVDIVPETLAKTTLARLDEGSVVNLERALRADGHVDGHFVQGHVDAVGEIVKIDRGEAGHLVSVRFPSEFARYVIPVGSVALDGISFTVARLVDERLTVAIIPHTLAATTAQYWEVGTPVNIEFDLLGKYVVRALQHGTTAGPSHRFLSG